MAFGKKSATSEVSNTSGSPRPQEGKKKKGHCARFWWIYLIAVLLIVLIVVLVVIFVAIPKKAQHDVNESRLEFTELKFLDPTSESITLSQKATLHNPSKFSPRLDSFNASFFLVTNGTVAAKRITQIELPEINASRPSSQQVITNQLLKIDNLDQLTDFATQVLENENVTTKLDGSTKLHLGSLPAYNTNYDEETTYKGLNGLKGFNVTNAIVDATPDLSPNIKAIAIIPNPSVMTIAMGNVTLNVYTVKMGFVGTTTILDMTLVPGENRFNMTGTLDQGKLAFSMGQGGIAELLISGQEALYNGQHLTYYEKALASKNLTLPMNVTQVLLDSAAAHS